MIKKTLLFIIFIVSFQSMAQTFGEYVNAEIHFKDNTKKDGFAYVNTTSDKILFKETKKSKKERYSSKEIARLILKKDTILREFHYKRANDRRAPRLLQKVIEDENVSLYIKLTKVNMLGLIGTIVKWEEVDYVYYISKDGAETAYFVGERSVTSKKQIGKFVKKHMSDCPDLVERAKNKEFRLRDIREVVTIYNNCSKN